MYDPGTGDLITDDYNITIEFLDTAEDWGASLLENGEYSGGFLDAFLDIDPDDHLGMNPDDPNSYVEGSDLYSAVSDWVTLIQVIVDNNGTGYPFDEIFDRQYAGDAEGVAGVSFLDVEDGGGSGTAGGHWDETTYLSELMTGWINATEDGTNQNYASAFTIAALEDLGYVLDPGSTY